MLNSTLLLNYMNQFFGYGELASDYWFVGMEEGGGHTEREIAQRVNRWDELGQGIVVDALLFHKAVQNARGESLSYLFEGRPKIQRTWAGLIRIFLAAKGQKDISAEVVRSIQSAKWGRLVSGNCLLELLPLPSPGINTWHYGKWSELPELQSRDDYRSHLIGTRVQKLRNLVKAYTPRCVVFYSVSPEYLLRWSEIAEVDFNVIEPEEICSGNQGQSFTARFYSNGLTMFVVIYHPVYTGLTKEYFEKVGQSIWAIAG